MYTITKTAPIYSTSRKSTKGDRARKADEKLTSSSSVKKVKVGGANKTAKSTKSAKIFSTKTEKKTPQKSPAKIAEPLPTIEPTVQTHAPERDAATVKSAKLIKPLVKNSIIETRPNDGSPSAIKFRISYGKDTPNTRPEYFRTPTTLNGVSRLNENGGCLNCGKHSRFNGSASTATSTEMPVIANNKEEFYKYLGIDTNPPQEKLSPEPSPTDATTLYNQRRSLRVFIQQRQNEFSTKTHEKVPKDDKSPDRRLKSPSVKLNGSNDEVKLSQTSPEDSKMINVKLASPNGTNDTSALISTSHIKQRRSYEPTSSPDVESSRPNVLNKNGMNQQTSPNALRETEIKCDAATETAAATAAATATAAAASQPNSNRPGQTNTGSVGDGTRQKRVHKRKVLLPSPMMLTEMFKRYKQCFNQGFAMRKHLRLQTTKRPKKRTLNNSTAPDTSDQPQAPDISDVPNENAGENIATNGHLAHSNCEDLINTFSPNSITHSNASTDSAIVIINNNNSNTNGTAQPTIMLHATDSLQWQQDQINQIDRTHFRNPIDPKHGAVLAILTHSISPEENDVIVVVQQSQITYWHSTSKVLSMFGVNRSWQRVAGIARVNEGKAFFFGFWTFKN